MAFGFVNKQKALLRSGRRPAASIPPPPRPLKPKRFERPAHQQTLSHRAGPLGPRARLTRQSAERRLSKGAKTSMGLTGRNAKNVWKATLAFEDSDELTYVTA